MKPADTENRNGRCHIYSLFVNNSFFVSFKEISQTYAPIFSGLTPRYGIKPKSYKKNYKQRHLLGPFPWYSSIAKKNKHEKKQFAFHLDQYPPFAAIYCLKLYLSGQL